MNPLEVLMLDEQIDGPGIALTTKQRQTLFESWWSELDQIEREQIVFGGQIVPAFQTVNCPPCGQELPLDYHGPCTKCGAREVKLVFTADTSGVSDALSQMEREMFALTVREHALNQQLQELCLQRDHDQHQLEHYRTVAQAQCDRINELQTELEQVRALIRLKDSAIDAFAAEVDRLEKLIDELDERIDRQSTQIGTQATTIAKQAQQINELRSKGLGLESARERLQQKCNDFDRICTAQTADIKAKDKRIEALIDQLNIRSDGKADVALIRCMGFGCRHIPGTCTATRDGINGDKA